MTDAMALQIALIVGISALSMWIIFMLAGVAKTIRVLASLVVVLWGAFWMVRLIVTAPLLK